MFIVVGESQEMLKEVCETVRSIKKEKSYEEILIGVGMGGQVPECLREGFEKAWGCLRRVPKG